MTWLDDLLRPFSRWTVGKRAVAQWRTLELGSGLSYESDPANERGILTATGGDAVLSDATPQAVGTTAAAGTGDEASRADHVHDLDLATVEAAIDGNPLTVGEPVADDDAATKGYVDAAIETAVDDATTAITAALGPLKGAGSAPDGVHIIAVTNPSGSTVQVETHAAHGLATGQRVQIFGGLVDDPATSAPWNGCWTVAVVDATRATLVGASITLTDYLLRDLTDGVPSGVTTGRGWLLPGVELVEVPHAAPELERSWVFDVKALHPYSDEDSAEVCAAYGTVAVRDGSSAAVPAVDIGESASGIASALIMGVADSGDGTIAVTLLLRNASGEHEIPALSGGATAGRVTITGAGGGANGTWDVARIDATTLELVGSTYTADAGSRGVCAWEHRIAVEVVGSDVARVWAYGLAGEEVPWRARVDDVIDARGTWA